MLEIGAQLDKEPPSRDPIIAAPLDEIEQVMVICRQLREQIDELPDGQLQASMTSLKQND